MGNERLAPDITSFTCYIWEDMNKQTKNLLNDLLSYCSDSRISYWCHTQKPTSLVLHCYIIISFFIGKKCFKLGLNTVKSDPYIMLCLASFLLPSCVPFCLSLPCQMQSIWRHLRKINSCSHTVSFISCDYYCMF